MRLYEIIDFEPRNSSISYLDRNKKIRNTRGTDLLGYGHFGKAYSSDSPKRLGQIKKIAKAGEVTNNTSAKDILQDGYLSYLHSVYELKKSGIKNKFFPVIHNLKIFRDADGNLSYDVDMEKLVGLNSDTIDYAILSLLWENLLDVELTEQSTFRNFVYILDKALDSGHFNEIKDEELREALMYIYRIKVKGHFMPDLHSGNVMLRITGTMPQLVLLDPLA